MISSSCLYPFACAGRSGLLLLLECRQKSTMLMKAGCRERDCSAFVIVTRLRGILKLIFISNSCKIICQGRADQLEMRPLKPDIGFFRSFHPHSGRNLLYPYPAAYRSSLRMHTFPRIEFRSCPYSSDILTNIIYVREHAINISGHFIISQS